MTMMDIAISKALNNGSIDPELFEIRAAEEEKLNACQLKFDTACSDAHQLRSELESSLNSVNMNPEILETATAEIEFQELAAREKRAICEKEAFRVRHALTREPIDATPVQGILSICFLGLIESAVNAVFFLNSNMSSGPAQALLLSTLIAGTNLFVCCVAGYLFGRGWSFGQSIKGETSIARIRAFCRIFSGLTACLIGYFHILVGCVRDQESFAIQHGWDSYLSAWLNPHSCFLMLAGLAMSLLAWNKGRTSFDDPYPGYAERGRAVERCSEDFTAALNEAMEEIHHQALEEENAFLKQKKDVLKEVKAYNSLVQRCRHLSRELDIAATLAHGRSMVQMTKLLDAYFAAKPGADQTCARAALETLATFEVSHQENLPEPIPVPDFFSFQPKLRAAKQKAQRQLSQLYQQAKKMASGGKS